MLRTLLLSAASLLFMASCNTDAEPVAPTPVVDTVPTNPAPALPGTKAIDFPADGYTQYTPVTFIEYLKANVASGTVVLDKAPENWIKKSHVAALVKLLDSTEPCAGISLRGSGPTPPDNVQSSVGAEALLILETYKQKTAYPAVPGSLQFIKMLQRNPNDADKLILIPQPHQIEEAKIWAAKL